MEVLIETVSREGPDDWVKFSCSAGRATAIWHGSAPAAGTRDHVEFELRDEQVVVTDDARDAIRDEADGRVTFVGLVEHAWSEGALSIRVMEGAVEVSVPLPLSFAVGQRVAATGGLTLFSMNL